MEIKIAPKDIKTHEYQIRNQRIKEKNKLNAENLIRNALQKQGMIKINILDTKMEKEKASIIARFISPKGEQKATFNLEKDKFGNWQIKNFEGSLEKAEIIKTSVDNEKFNVIIPNNDLVIDLSVIKAIQRGNSYQIEHPVIGKLGYLSKENITEDNIKILFSLFASETGLNVKYVNKFNVIYEDSDYTYEEPSYAEVNSSVQNIQEKNQLNYYVKAKSIDYYTSLRENFNKVLKIQAAEIIRRNLFNWKTGIPKIIDVESFVEMENGSYTGNVLVKAKIDKNETVFALPVVKGKIVCKGNLNNYIIDQKEFEDIVKNKIENYLKDTLKKDLDTIFIAEAHDREKLRQALQGIQTKNVVKVFPVAKVNLENVEVGDIINLQGLKYKVEEGDNPAYYRLVLIEE